MNKQSEQGQAAVAVIIIIAIIVFGMYLVSPAHTGGDIFTAFWSFVASL